MGSLLFIPWFKLEEWPLKIGDFTIPIQPFGILVAIGVLLGVRIAEARAEKEGIAKSVVADFAAHVVIIGFILCYFLNALFYEPEVYLEIFRDPTVLFKKYLGLSSFGGFIGATVGLLIWRARRKLPVMPVADAVMYGLPFGWLFGRIGCFTVHDHPGAVTDFFLAVADYRVGDPPYEPRHDLGFYEVLWSIACIATLLVLGRKRRKQGFYVALVPILYAPVRFGLDFLRAGPDDGGDVRYFGLTPGHYSSLALLAGGIALAVYVHKRQESEIPEKMRPPKAAAEKAAGKPDAADAPKPRKAKKAKEDG